MRVLLIKTSSMGDLFHTLPALTDAGKAIPGIRFDWIAEKSFAEIPSWHPLVDRVIPVALRQWRKAIFSRQTLEGLREFRQQLRSENYDVVLDAQGLVKSAFLGFFAEGVRAGLDWSSARESLASLAYQRKHTVNFYQHAIVRMRQLFSLALNYPLPMSAPDFGLDKTQLIAQPSEKYVVFLHGTTWESKQWPESYWLQLVDIAANAGYRVKVSGGSDEEVARAFRLAKHHPMVDAMPRLNILTMAKLLANAKAAVAVDTGFGHLAAALNLPTVSIYGSTNPEYTGALGERSVHLTTKFPCAPCLARDCQYKEATAVMPACYAEITPQRVWGAVMSELRAQL